MKIISRLPALSPLENTGEQLTITAPGLVATLRVRLGQLSWRCAGAARSAAATALRKSIATVTGPTPPADPG